MLLLIACARNDGPRAPTQLGPTPAGEFYWFEVLRSLDQDELLVNELDRRRQDLGERLVFDRLFGEWVVRPPAAATLVTAVARPSAPPVTVEYVLTRGGRRRPRVQPYLASGGVYRWITLQPGLAGHYEITRRVLAEDLRWSGTAVAVAADAARDPDFFAWTVPAAHGQTPHDAAGRPALSAAQAATDFVRWAAERTRWAAEACATGDLRAALYHLGSALHAVQDLASHDGRTNAEHAWNAVTGEDPDDPEHPDALFDLARNLSRAYLVDAALPLVGECAGRMAGLAGASAYSHGEKKARFGLRRDLTHTSYCDYVDYGLGQRNPVQWRLHCWRAPRVLQPPYPVVRWSRAATHEAIVARIAAELRGGRTTP